MNKYNRFVTTDGLYQHVLRGGAASADSQDVLTATQDTFDPVDNSFAYAIIPGADGVKFSVMEEDGVRVSDERIGYTYKANQTITGRFTRLIRETGDCVILLGSVGEMFYPRPWIHTLYALPFEATRQSTSGVAVYIPETYKLFKGKDFGFIIKIEFEAIAEADIEFGTAKIRKGTTDLVDLVAYLQSVEDNVATYYLAVSNTDLDAGAAHEAFTVNEGNNLLIPLTLDNEGEHKVSLQLTEMEIDTAVLKTSGRVLSEQQIDIDVTEFIPISDANILTYSLAEETGDAVIGDGTIDIEVAHGTTVTALVATFTTSPDITSIKVGETAQVSGTTANDFTEPVTYAVIAEDGETTKDWVVTVTVAEAEEE